MDIRIGIVPLPIFIAVIGLLAGVRPNGQGAGRSDNEYPDPDGRRLCLRRNRKAYPGFAKDRRRGDLRDVRPVLSGLCRCDPAPLKESITTFTEQSNFLYLFIGSIIVGSILGMDRHMLIGGFLKIFAPIVAGSIAAAAVGIGLGTALGLGLKHTAFMIVLPVMAGGVGEGAIPLSIGYSTLGGGVQGDLLAEIYRQ